MADRQAEITNFLHTAGWRDATRSTLAGDASPRRYDRLLSAQLGQTAVLMVAPPDNRAEMQMFIKVAQHLTAHNLSAPTIIACDASQGLMLLEDLGDDLFARVCASKAQQSPPLYEAAVDVLTQVKLLPALSELPHYTNEVYLREANLLVEWYLPGATDKAISAEVHTDFEDLVEEACGKIKGDHTCLVLRDYHAENLLWLPQRSGIAKVGLLDFQDALLGHPAYDLVSLLEDARRDTSPELQSAMIDRYLGQNPQDRDAFFLAYATLGAQRNLKIMGIFARLCRRDGKPAYVDMIPRVWAHLQNDLAHPCMTHLRKFVQDHVPAPSKTVLQNLKGGLL